MLEKLFPLELPPGFLNNGTTYQSKGRWFIGSLVRFFQGTIQPIGGWVKRTTTGATISGTPNAALSWQTNDGNTWLVIGTSTHLYVVSSTNVVSDITPTSPDAFGQPFPGPPYSWQLENFGSYLIAVFNVSVLTPLGSGYAINIFKWTGDPTVRATVVGNNFVTPNSSFGVVVTPERFLFILRGADPAISDTPPSNIVN